MSDATQPYDIAMIGSGIACTLALQALLEQLPSSRTGTPVRIAVIERDREFWRGLPYGDRSSPNSLIITTLGEFVPDEERDAFVAWLEAEGPQWRKRLQLGGGAVAEAWLADNAAAIEQREWDEIYVPRRLYGDFAEWRLAAAITESETKGDATVTLISGEAVDIVPADGGYRIEVAASESRQTVQSRLVVLAIGSPPYHPLAGSPEAQAHGVAYVNNAYLPGLDQNLEAILAATSAQPQGTRNLLIVGSNATSLELLYMIARDPAARARLDSVVALSLGGNLPRRMSKNRFLKPAFPRLQQLMTAAGVAASDVIAAAEADVAALDDGATPIGDTFHHLGSLLAEVLSRQDARVQRDFHHRFGMRFTRLIRRAGAEYRDAAESLVAAGLLQLTAGAFERLDVEEPQLARLCYRPAGRSDVVRWPTPFAAVVNCAGFEELSTQSSSPLIAALLANAVAQANPTRRGFEVNERFEAAAGLFVCGPLLGGVFNAAAQYWHVENVRRIHAVARRLGATLSERIAEGD